MEKRLTLCYKEKGFKFSQEIDKRALFVFFKDNQFNLKKAQYSIEKSGNYYHHFITDNPNGFMNIQFEDRYLIILKESITEMQLKNLKLNWKGKIMASNTTLYCTKVLIENFNNDLKDKDFEERLFNYKEFIK